MFRPFVLITAILTFLTAGCRDRAVASYQIPKETDASASPAVESPAAMPPMSAAAPAAGAPAGAPGAQAAVMPAGLTLTWTAPAAWQPKALGTMRKGSFTVPGKDGANADLSIISLPGAVGGELANINRWRGQISLDPITEAELAGATTRVVVGDLTFTVVDLVGTGDQAQRILGAMVPFDQSIWFFKLSGPAALVLEQKPAFLSFLQTVKASKPSAQ